MRRQLNIVATFLTIAIIVYLFSDVSQLKGGVWQRIPLNVHQTNNSFAGDLVNINDYDYGDNPNVENTWDV